MVDRRNWRQPWAAANIWYKILTRRIGRGEKVLQADELNLMADSFRHKTSLLRYYEPKKMRSFLSNFSFVLWDKIHEIFKEPVVLRLSRVCLDMKGQNCLWKNKWENKQRIKQELILEYAIVKSLPFNERQRSSLLYWNRDSGFAVKNIGKPLGDSSGELFWMLLLFL